MLFPPAPKDGSCSTGRSDDEGTTTTMPLRRPLVAFHRRGKALHLQKDVGVALQAGQLLRRERRFRGREVSVIVSVTSTESNVSLQATAALLAPSSPGGSPSPAHGHAKLS